jgi:Fur family ferric uptake transcriptional regulator
MTASHVTPAAPAPDLESAMAAIRARGLRLSAARRLVLEALFAADGPVTAEQVADGIGGRVPRSDLASVYRNLETLEGLGLVRHVHLGHGPGLYELTRDGEREYLVCDRCGALRSVSPAALDGVRAVIRSSFGFEVRFTHFPIVGVCPGCSEEGKDVRT